VKNLAVGRGCQMPLPTAEQQILRCAQNDNKRAGYAVSSPESITILNRAKRLSLVILNGAKQLTLSS